MNFVPFLLLIFFAGQPLLAFQKVNLNAASLEQIALLPQVGSKLAKNIIAFRKNNFPLNHADDLLRVSGMSPKKLLVISDKIEFTLRKKKPEKKSLPIPQAKKDLIPLRDLIKVSLCRNFLRKESNNNLLKRIKNAAYLPTISLFADYDHTHGDSEKLIEVGNDTFYKRNNKNFSVGVKATFYFSKALYNSHELEARKFIAKQNYAREKLAKEIRENYFQLKKLREKIGEGRSDYENKFFQNEIEKIESILNEKSDGAFSIFENNSQQYQEIISSC